MIEAHTENEIDLCRRIVSRLADKLQTEAITINVHTVHTINPAFRETAFTLAGYLHQLSNLVS